MPVSSIEGQIVNENYELIRELGSGGMGTVYAAQNRSLDRMVALKILKPQRSYDSLVRGQMITEAKAAARIKHPNVVAVNAAGETDDGLIYIEMELLHGVDLEELLANEELLDISRARSILLQIARGLQAAHESGVIHRDVKPANCFVFTDDGCDEERVKILDFGIAKIIRNANETAKVDGSTRPMLTRRYAAPEVNRGNSSSPASDIYSFGVLAYRTLTGQFPHRVDNGEFVDPSEYRPELPAHLCEMLRKSLMPDPGERAQTMSQVIASLERQPGRSRSRVMRWGLGGTVVAAFAVVMAFVFGFAGAEPSVVKKSYEISASVPCMTQHMLTVPFEVASPPQPLAPRPPPPETRPRRWTPEAIMKRVGRKSLSTCRDFVDLSVGKMDFFVEVSSHMVIDLDVTPSDDALLACVGDELYHKKIRQVERGDFEFSLRPPRRTRSK